MHTDNSTSDHPDHPTSDDTDGQDDILSMMQSMMSKAENEIALIKKFCDPRTPEQDRLALLAKLHEPGGSSLADVTLHGLCNSTPAVREAVIAKHTSTETLDDEHVLRVVASLVHADDADVRDSARRIASIGGESLPDILLRGELHQLNTFLDPRTHDAERIRIVSRLKNASLETLQLLSALGLHDQSKKVQAAVHKILNKNSTTIAATPQDQLSPVFRFIDPRTSASDRLSIARELRTEREAGNLLFFLHVMCGEETEFFDLVEDSFIDYPRVRDDVLMDAFKDLSFHKNKAVRDRVECTFDLDNFMLGSLTKTVERISSQTDQLKDPRTPPEQKIVVMKRLANMGLAGHSDVVLYGLHDPDARIRSEVVDLIHAARTSKANSLLKELSESPIPYVKAAAKEALGAPPAKTDYTSQSAAAKKPKKRAR